MFLYMDQLQKQLDNEEFQEIGSMSAFKVLQHKKSRQQRKGTGYGNPLDALDASSVIIKAMGHESKRDQAADQGMMAMLMMQDIRPLILMEEPMAEYKIGLLMIMYLIQDKQHTEATEFINEERLTRLLKHV
ncbi:hypothetical protein Tco_0429557 [Tanacetum coccineum]